MHCLLNGSLVYVRRASQTFGALVEATLSRSTASKRSAAASLWFKSAPRLDYKKRARTRSSRSLWLPSESKEMLFAKAASGTESFRTYWNVIRKELNINSSSMQSLSQLTRSWSLSNTKSLSRIGQDRAIMRSVRAKLIKRMKLSSMPCDIRRSVTTRSTISFTITLSG